MKPPRVIPGKARTFNAMSAVTVVPFDSVHSLLPDAVCVALVPSSTTAPRSTKRLVAYALAAGVIPGRSRSSE
jgi:hypothetical protein